MLFRPLGIEIARAKRELRDRLFARARSTRRASALDVHAEARAADRYDPALWLNLVGVGVGEKVTAGERTGLVCVKVYVARKFAASEVPANELVPPHGVYATTTKMDGVVHASVTNIGTRPTVDDSGRTSIETHIFNTNRDLYGSAIRIGFVQRLRDERAFESIDLLKAQIAADVQRARMLFDRLSL